MEQRETTDIFPFGSWISSTLATLSHNIPNWIWFSNLRQPCNTNQSLIAWSYISNLIILTLEVDVMYFVRKYFFVFHEINHMKLSPWGLTLSPLPNNPPSGCHIFPIWILWVIMNSKSKYDNLEIYVFESTTKLKYQVPSERFLQ